jgi:23S rRNA pseudouridine2457 synthase
VQDHLIFHKPYGVISQFTPEPGAPHATLGDYIPVKGVYPAGRLDHDSEGLLLLTSDGELQHRLTDPKFQHPRTYWAQVEGVPDEPALAALRAGGLRIQNYLTRPCLARQIHLDLPPRQPPIRFRAAIPASWLELTLVEGRNRQVRRMTAAVGLPTLRLIRAAIGPVRLDGLGPGEWRRLTGEELRDLARVGRR